MRPLLIGQAPGRKSASTMGPRTASGRRLAQLAHVDPSGLSRVFRLRNLLPAWPGAASGKGDAFPRAAAKRAAKRMRLVGGPVVFLGTNVAAAFGVADRPFLRWFGFHGNRAVVFPHPSGISHWWNEPVNVKRAQRFLRNLVRKEA